MPHLLLLYSASRQLGRFAPELQDSAHLLDKEDEAASMRKMWATCHGSGGTYLSIKLRRHLTPDALNSAQLVWAAVPLASLQVLAVKPVGEGDRAGEQQVQTMSTSYLLGTMQLGKDARANSGACLRAAFSVLRPSSSGFY